jgi:hypothetical protein
MENRRLPLSKTCGWICEAIFQKAECVRMLFPLPEGEGQGEGEGAPFIQKVGSFMKNPNPTVTAFETWRCQRREKLFDSARMGRSPMNWDVVVLRLHTDVGIFGHASVSSGNHRAGRARPPRQRT